MPKRDEAFMKQQRERILDAAYRCFLAKGFRGTSIRDICREADLSVGAIYIHFENQDAIFGAVCEQITKQTSSAVPRDCSVEEFIRELTTILIECHKNPSMTDLNHQLLADAFSTDYMADVYKKLLTFSTTWMKNQIERFAESGEINMPFDLDTTTQALNSFLTGFGIRLYFEGGQSDEIIEQQMHSLIAHQIGAPPVAKRQLDNLRNIG